MSPPRVRSVERPDSAPPRSSALPSTVPRQAPTWKSARAPRLCFFFFGASASSAAALAAASPATGVVVVVGAAGISGVGLRVRDARGSGQQQQRASDVAHQQPFPRRYASVLAT
jgi:hypothetical protein